MATKRRAVFVTPFSSQKTTDTEIAPPDGQTNPTMKTPAGTFLFPVSSSRMDKIHHVTPMTKHKIKQGLCKVIAACPQGADPNTPSWTFRTVSQTSQAPTTDEIEKRQTECGENEDTCVAIAEIEDVYDYVATPAEPETTTLTTAGASKRMKVRTNKKLLEESLLEVRKDKIDKIKKSTILDENPKTTEDASVEE